MFRIKLVGVPLAALAAFAIPTGSALASTATFVSPVADATISQNVNFTVDTSGDAGAAQVNFYIDSNGIPGTFLGSGTDQGSGVYSTQVDVGGWADSPITIDANVVDSSGQPIEMISENLTVANDVTGPTITATTPAADSNVSGTFTLSVAAADPSGIAVAEYSVEGGTTPAQPLVADGSGNYTASIDTAAQNIPNGDFYIDLHFQDGGGGYATDDTVHLNVENPVAPTITPNTLVADKAQYRTDETQIEVGDIVEAYGMQADGYPAPVISYLWNICRGQVCNGVTPGPDGTYTVQPADEGATLTLMATATNSEGTDFTSVPFGVIAPAYVAPYSGSSDPSSSQSSGDTTPPATPPAPVVTPPVTPPVVPPVTPTVTPPTVTKVTPAQEAAQKAAEKSVATAQKRVTATAVVVVKAATAQKSSVDQLAAAKHQVAAAKAAVNAGTATAAERKKLVAAQATLQAAETKVIDKAVAAAGDRSKLAAAQKTLDAKQSALAKLKGKAPVTPPVQAKPVTKAVVIAQNTVNADTKAVAKADAAENVAVDHYTASQKQVATATKAANTGTATAAEQKQLAAARHTLQAAKTTVIAAAVDNTAATSKLATAQKALVVAKAAKPTK